jgi:hypothetical protein
MAKDDRNDKTTARPTGRGSKGAALLPSPEDALQSGVMIPLKNIRLDGDTQMRVELDGDTVQDYVVAVIRGDDFPPVVVFFDGCEFWMADGFHRWEAHDKAERAKIKAIVYRGTRLDAQVYACQANLKGQKRPTRADKRKAVIAVLRDILRSPTYAERLDSDGAIADLCGVDRTTVLRIREELRTGRAMHTLPASEAGAPVAQVRRGRDGKTYTIKPREPKAPTPQPAHSHLDGPSPAHPPATSYSPASAPLRDLPVSAAGPACVVPDDVRIEVRLALHTHRAAGVVQKIAEREEAISSGTWAAIERLVGAGGAA